MKKKRWSAVLKLLSPYRGRIIALNVLTSVQSALQVAFALVTRYVVDAAINENGRLLFWAVALMTTLLLTALVHAIYAWLTGSTSDRCTAHFRKKLLESAIYSEGEQMHAYHSGTLLSHGMTDVATVCEGVTGALPTITGQVVRLIASFAAVIILSKDVLPVVLIGAAVVAVISAGVRPALKRRHADVRKAEDREMSDMQEDFQQIELIRGLQAQKQILGRFDLRLKDSLCAKKKRRFWSVGISSGVFFLSQTATAAVLLWGASQVAHKSMSYGDLTAMLQLIALMRAPILGMSGTWTRLTGVEVAAERIEALLNKREEITPEQTPDCHVRAVVFEHVSFSYPGKEEAVLSDYSATFSLENWSCLTGFSGKGKSTVFKLILGLYTPNQGRVYLDTDVGQIPCGRQTAGLFAYVPQNYALFSGTVMENFLLVAPDMEKADWEQALQTAEAQFLMELPLAEQTPLQENNSGLSMGQIQRLAIARAVLMKRQIFLLDECTSALDAQTERKVLTNLAALGKQAIVVTHRPQVLRDMQDIRYTEMDDAGKTE